MALSLRSEVRRLRVFDLEQVRHQEPGQEWVPHWHEEWSFGAIVRGECRCSVAGRPFVARTGDVIAIAPGVVHTGALSAPQYRGAVLVTMLYVPTDWLAHEALVAPSRSGVVRMPRLAESARGLATTAEAQAWLRRVVPALRRRLPADSGAVEPAPASAAMRALIERVQQAVVGDDLSVADLANRCGVSRERIHRVLTAWIGMAPGDYLRAVRLHRARQMLLAGEPAAAVAAECGFADQAHFTRWFRRSFGYTPGDLLQAAARG